MKTPARIAHLDTRIAWPVVGLGVAIGLVLLLLGGNGGALVLTDTLLMILFAASLNLIMSYGGMVSFGHAAYFGLGAYGFTLSVARFDLPIPLALAIGPVVATLGALVFGAISVRLTRIYFAMLTLAFGEITFTVLFQWYGFTGGDTGITDFMTPRFGLSEQAFTALVLAVVVICLLLLWRVVNSPLGLAIRSVGQDPFRAAASGLNPKRVQLTAFVIAGFFAGVAGTLFSVFNGNAFPDYAGIGLTLDSLVMVVLGGLYSFGGAIYGAVVYTLLKTYVPLIIPQWELVVGVILLAVVMVMPHGFAGGIRILAGLLRKERAGE